MLNPYLHQPRVDQELTDKLTELDFTFGPFVFIDFQGRCRIVITSATESGCLWYRLRPETAEFRGQGKGHGVMCAQRDLECDGCEEVCG